MSFHIIIPARYDSKRLPGKVLLPLKGKPIVQWVYERAMQSGAKSVTIATDDHRILKAIEAFGGNGLLTAPEHESGSDRIAEAARRLNLTQQEVIVNVQGDEPFIPVATIIQVAQNCAHFSAPMATLCKPIQDWAKIQDPNAVKVVMNAQNEALYFSRSVIPYVRQDEDDKRSPETLIDYYHHVGIYAYRADFLQQYVAWGPCALEMAERLEQLRVLWHGNKIHVALACETPAGDINTLADYELALR